MADITENIDVTSSWTKVAEDTDTDILITNQSPNDLEYGYTDADSAPSASLTVGHVLKPGEVMRRFCTGFLWARTIRTAASSYVTVTASA